MKIFKNDFGDIVWKDDNMVCVGDKMTCDWVFLELWRNEIPVSWIYIRYHIIDKLQTIKSKKINELILQNDIRSIEGCGYCQPYINSYYFSDKDWGYIPDDLQKLLREDDKYSCCVHKGKKQFPVFCKYKNSWIKKKTLKN